MSRKFSLGGGHDVTVYDDALWDAMQSAVAYCYTVFPHANVAYRTLRAQHDALLKELGRLRQDLAAERFNRREWQDRARDMERERDAALDPGKAASEPLPEMGQPEFGSKAKSRWFRYHGNRKAAD